MSKMLFRLSCLNNWEDKFHTMMRVNRPNLDAEWRPGKVQIWSLQAAGFELKISIYLFIVGLTCLIWERAIDTEPRWRSEEFNVGNGRCFDAIAHQILV